MGAMQVAAPQLRKLSSAVRQQESYLPEVAPHFYLPQTPLGVVEAQDTSAVAAVE